MLRAISPVTHFGITYSNRLPPSSARLSQLPCSHFPVMGDSEPRGTYEQHEKGMADGADSSRGGGPLSANILPHLFNLYNCTSSAPDYEIYDPNATFEDPLMCAHGTKQIKSAFYSIPKVFSEAKMGEYTVHENPTGPGTGEINIDNIQHYKLLGRQIDVNSLIKLQVKDGKIVRHEDLWDKKPLWDRDTVKVPLLGRLIEKLRRGNMLLTHALMGCGKDPKPKDS